MKGDTGAGFSVARALQRKWPDVPILYLSEYSGTDVEQEALESARGHDFIAKHQRNKALQLKAHTYSDHADKLKLFISERLLEYIEYDEKFLHFKGIAAELRHNGVISFDRAQTALQRALADTRARGDDGGDYQAGLDALHYLWDLLDLSTAENLSLHVGNLLCECEERYCQQLLGDAEAPPVAATFDPQTAVWRALTIVGGEPGDAPDGATAHVVDDGRVHARLESTNALLGRANHLVLLVENLLRNAQFYAGKRGYGAAFTPIAVTLGEEDGHICLRVYNRGLPIREADRERLFQLGYSRRRSGEHHGRGLGLYFVNEIVKGYEGRIQVTNVATPATHYDLRMECANGEALARVVSIDVEDGRPGCSVGGESVGTAVSWTLPAPLARLVVTAPDAPNERVLQGFADKGEQVWFDPAHPEHPHWRLRYRAKRWSPRLTFEPLRMGGVEVELRLPTAQRRIDSAAADPGAIDAELAPPDLEGSTDSPA
jgi:signal transduction histidine kinase